MKNALNNPKNPLSFQDDGTVILSTEIALMRNLAGYKFVKTASNSDLQDILEAVTMAVNEEFSGGYNVYTPDLQDPFIGELWAEKQITSVGFEDKETPRGVFLSRCSDTAIVVNDENHLKLFVKEYGLAPEKCWQTVSDIDDMIEKRVLYSFSPQFGYLTSGIADVGTGMKVSFTFHLPAMAMQGKIGDLYDFAEAKDFDINGARGDCDPEGDLYKISNNITIGNSEEQIISDMRKVAVSIAVFEQQTRRLLVKEDYDTLIDSVQRALGMLKYARMMNYIEAANLLSKVRLGILTQTVRNLRIETIDEILKRIKPAKLNYDSCETLEYSREEMLRADIIRQSLDCG